MDTCETKTNTCETSSGAKSSPETKCGCEGICGGDLIVCAIHFWKKALFQAEGKVMVDILKLKI